MSVQEFTLRLRHKGDDVTVFEETLRVPIDMAPEALYKVFVDAQDVAAIYQAFNHPEEPFHKVTLESMRAEESQRIAEKYRQERESQGKNPVKVKCQHCYQPFTSERQRDLHEKNFHGTSIEEAVL